jgi:phosphoribosylaminoimidazolecarboxamide formyltransferase / IMP cyclohydrolase
MKKAIISVSDKTGVLDFTNKILPQFEILSTSGTFALLQDAKVPVQKVEDYTGIPELLGGKVKTLHPKIFAGILCADGTEEIPPIRLVVVNLYSIAKGEVDIGGCALLRAAAKNYENVLVVCDPRDYDEVARRLNSGEVDLEFRRAMAAKAFRLTASYDAQIADCLGTEVFPGLLPLSYAKAKDLSYGENPTTQAALYLDLEKKIGTVANAVQLLGKPLSYNNILDADAGLELVKKFDRPACAIIKHNNPCGFAVKADVEKAFIAAYEADPLCAFGGIVAFNRSIDCDTAIAMQKRFFDLVIAPDFDDEAIAILKGKNLRILQTGEFTADVKRFALKEVTGGLLVQTVEPFSIQKDTCRTVTDRSPTGEEFIDLLIAAKVNQEVKSNSSVIVKDGVAIGVGSGQMSRIDSVFLALRKAKDNSRGAVLSSDGFFPFADSIEAAAASGITAIIQPGGSKKDGEVIQACNQHGIAMVFTGKRLFKH